MSEHHEISRHEVIERINSLVAVHAIHRSELTFPRKKQESGIARFRNPSNGKTWTGHGRTPAWFKAIPNAREVCKI